MPSFNQDTLTKAIQRALKNGWSLPEHFDAWNVDDSGHIIYYSSGTKFEPFSPYDVIYNHSFSRALWGDDPLPGGLGEWLYRPLWEWHLTKMVVAKDPIQYLADNI